MADEQLPPFGVRGLCSPEKPFSVLQLSERQYDDSITSYPDAALTWLDDDDGDTVTVGTGFELRERLKDRLPRHAPRVKFGNLETKQIEDRYIHLFDISQSQTSLDVWREYEAYFSKTQTSTSKGSTTESMSRKISNSQKVADNTSSNTLGKDTLHAQLQTATPSHTTHVSTSDALPEIVSGLGVQLDHLAGFLQGTSSTLRRVAEKSRATDTSPIEDVLTGMTSILGEVGAFGLEVIEKLSEPKSEMVAYPSIPGRASTITSSSAEESITSRSQNGLSDVESVRFVPFTAHQESLDRNASQVPQTHVKDETNQRGFECGKDDRLNLLNAELRHLRRLVHLNRLDFHQTSARKAGMRADEGQSHQTAELGRSVERRNHNRSLREVRARLDRCNLMSCTLMQESSDTTASLTEIAAVSKQEPILDQDADAIDAAFSARYPPLISLRKSKTFDVLRRPDDKIQDIVTASLGKAERPSPQVFDAETQRRKEFAKSCYPTQEYTPGPGTTQIKVAAPKIATRIQVRELHEPSDVEPATATAPPQSQLNNVTHPIVFSHNVTVNNNIPPIEELPPLKIFAPQTPEKTLPGAWPMPTTENIAESSQSRVESSGAFFNRMIEASRSSSGVFPIHDAGNKRLHRHRSLINPETRSRPSLDLNRSQTVKHANSAARLNGPFSPLFPAPPPLPQSYSDDMEQSIKQAAGPIRNVHRSMSERRPRSLYEPYRLNGVHRPFEPVWEDHLQRQKENLPNPGAVIVDASNFEPGTTEQGIRDLLADDCRTVIGINTLVSCRIISTEPVVIAKLVIKDKVHADRVIDRFNNKWVKGRPLHFEYAKTGIDARINRIRGALPSEESPSVRHQHSVPNLHAATNTSSKPTFAEFVSRPRPILNQETPVMPKESPLPMAPLPSQPDLTPGFAPAIKAHIVECQQQLKSMGYGATDPVLFSRLHVYAAAAGGVIHDAIDMIEEDKRANALGRLEKRIEKSRTRHIEDETSEVSDLEQEDNDELETAIRKSMEDM